MLEGKLQLFELDILDFGRYGSYRSLLDDAISTDRDRAFSNIRYMAALAHYLYQIGGFDDYMFIGGAGVLGNIVRYIGDERILDCRDIHDLDIVLRNKNYLPILQGFIDILDISAKSLSIKDKMTLRGHSYDAEDNSVDETTIDLYLPNGHPKKGVLVSSSYISGDEWESKTKADFFGVPVSIANPLTLLCMKLNISSEKRNLRRKKDCEDIVNLLGVMERDNLSPHVLCGRLTNQQFEKFKMITANDCSGCYEGPIEYVLKPTNDYIERVIKLREEINKT